MRSRVATYNTRFHASLFGNDRSEGKSRRVTMISSAVRIIAILLTAGLLAVGVVFASSQISHADPPANPDAAKYDFYNISSNITAYFSNTLEPGKGVDLSDDWQKVADSAATGGDFLGYSDPKITQFGQWLMSRVTGTANELDYRSLIVQDGEKGAGSSIAKGALHYAYYGALLNATGLDSMNDLQTSMSWLTDTIGGTILMLLFLLVWLVDGLFFVVFKLLDMLNPFKLLYYGVAALNPTLASGMLGGKETPQWMSTMANWISGWYQALVNLSWTVLMPVFIATFIGSVFLWRRTHVMQGIKKIAIRGFFLVFGIPLIGSMYTGTLETMADAGGGGNIGATKIIASTYVDFESWAKNTRLAVPEGATLTWDKTRSAPSGATMDGIRQTAMAINNMSLGLNLDNPNISDLGTITSEATNQTASEQAEQAKSDAMAGFFGDMGITAKVFDMLRRFVSHSIYSGADFETDVKAQITQIAQRDPAVASCATTWFSVDADGKETIQKSQIKTSDGKEAPKCSDDKISSNPIIAVPAGVGLTGSDSASPWRSQGVNFSSPGVALSIDTAPVSDPNGKPYPANLSPLSMYNYLNTAFGPNSLRMYSSYNIVASTTRQYHYSVSAVGSSLQRFLYWSNSVTLMICFLVLGFAYAIGMAAGVIRHSLRVITAVPFATLGSIASITKFIVYTFALIIEIMVTLFLYRLVQTFLLSLPTLFENGLSNLFAGLGSVGSIITNLGMLSGVVSILSTIFLAGMTIPLIRVRGAVVRASTEAMTKFVDRLMNAYVTPPAPGRAARAAGRGAMAGAGLAAGGRALRGRGGRGGMMPGSAMAGGAAVGGLAGYALGKGGAGGMPLFNGTDSEAVDEASGYEGMSAGSAHDGLGTSADDRQLAGAVRARGGLSEPDAASEFQKSVADSMEGQAQAAKTKRQAKMTAMKAAANVGIGVAEAAAGNPVSGGMSIVEGVKQAGDAKAQKNLAKKQQIAATEARIDVGGKTSAQYANAQHQADKAQAQVERRGADQGIGHHRRGSIGGGGNGSRPNRAGRPASTPAQQQTSVPPARQAPVPTVKPTAGKSTPVSAAAPKAAATKIPGGGKAAMAARVVQTASSMRGSSMRGRTEESDES